MTFLGGTEQALDWRMSSTPAELSLINDTEFLEKLEDWQAEPAARSGDAGVEREPFSDAFDLLERGLGVKASAIRATPAATAQYAADERADVSEEPRIPYAAAAVVLLVCLTAGAASAAALFHDRLAQITAPRSASR